MTKAGNFGRVMIPLIVAQGLSGCVSSEPLKSPFQSPISPVATSEVFPQTLEDDVTSPPQEQVYPVCATPPDTQDLRIVCGRLNPLLAGFSKITGEMAFYPTSSLETEADVQRYNDDERQRVIDFLMQIPVQDIDNDIYQYVPPEDLQIPTVGFFGAGSPYWDQLLGQPLADTVVNTIFANEMLTYGLMEQIGIDPALIIRIREKSLQSGIIIDPRVGPSILGVGLNTGQVGIVSNGGTVLDPLTSAYIALNSGFGKGQDFGTNRSIIFINPAYVDKSANVERHPIYPDIIDPVILYILYMSNELGNRMAEILSIVPEFREVFVKMLEHWDEKYGTGMDLSTIYLPAVGQTEIDPKIIESEVVFHEIFSNFMELEVLKSLVENGLISEKYFEQHKEVALAHISIVSTEIEQRVNLKQEIERYNQLLTVYARLTEQAVRLEKKEQIPKVTRKSARNERKRKAIANSANEEARNIAIRALGMASSSPALVNWAQDFYAGMGYSQGDIPVGVDKSLLHYINVLGLPRKEAQRMAKLPFGLTTNDQKLRRFA